MGQLRHIVRALRRPHRELSGNGPVPEMKRQRLLGRQAPILPETRLYIGAGETPKGGVPCRALALDLVRAAGDVPALDDSLQEAVLQKAFAVRSRQVARR